jgi:CAP-Gly domain-containing linker protein 1
LFIPCKHLSTEILEQETIALYEERISAFEAERYDSEALVQALEEKLRVASYQPSPEELSKQASTAAQIDNETLKEQVTHLQQRISHLEDQLEDAQALVEREEEAAKVRIARYKEKDTQRQQELEDLRHLATSATKSDSAARTRVEELEEALRENTAALEDARAEIESLRTDLTVSLAVFVNKVFSLPFG